MNIQHQAESQRFVAIVDGSECLLSYRLEADVVSMDSVEVPKAVGGRGIAGDLTRHALNWAAGKNLRVRPRCPYVKRWIERHPDAIEGLSLRYS